MATKRSLPDVWLRELKKVAGEKEKPPEILENTGIVISGPSQTVMHRETP